MELYHKIWNRFQLVIADFHFLQYITRAGTHLEASNHLVLPGTQVAILNIYILCFIRAQGFWLQKNLIITTKTAKDLTFDNIDLDCLACIEGFGDLDLLSCEFWWPLLVKL